jgi:hypothetical protein
MSITDPRKEITGREGDKEDRMANSRPITLLLSSSPCFFLLRTASRVAR